MADDGNEYEQAEQTLDLLQGMEDGRSSGYLVTSFLVIAKIEMPTTPDDVGYRFYRRGDPDGQLGLARYLDQYVHQRIFGAL